MIRIKISFVMKINNLITNNLESIMLNGTIVEDLPYDIVIGYKQLGNIN